MNVFLERLGRLKEELGVESDTAVASRLGMTKTAFAERKRREAFPEEHLFALLAKSPDLVIDVTYVLSGVREEGNPRAVTDKVARYVGSEKDPGMQELGGAAMRKHAAEQAARAPYLKAIADRAPWCTLDDLEWIIEFMDLCRTDRAAADSRRQRRQSNTDMGGGVHVSGDGNITAGRDMTQGQATRGRNSRPR